VPYKQYGVKNMSNAKRMIGTIVALILAGLAAGAEPGVWPGSAGVVGAETFSDYMGGGLSRFRIELPEGVKRSQVLVRADNVFIRVESGASEWRRGVSAFIYRPGYQIAWVEDVDVNQPWKPQFKKAPMAKLAGTLIDPNGRPAGGQELVFMYTISEECEFFHRVSSCLLAPSNIAKATSEPNGRFEVQLPVFEDDPFMERYGLRHGDGELYPRTIEMILPEWVPHFGLFSGPFMLEPKSFELKRRYDKPLDIKIIRKPK
jgi:hypothetical protein